MRGQIQPFDGRVADTGWLAFPYAANYQLFSAGYSVPGYRKIGDLVYLKGIITRNTGTAGAGSTCGNLPTGFQPPDVKIFEGNLSGARCRIDVLATGAIHHEDTALTVGGFLSLDGIFFSTLA